LGSARRGSNPLGVVFADPKSVWSVLEGRHWCQFAKRWLYLSCWIRIEAKNHGAQHFKVSIQGWRSASRHWHSRLPPSLKKPACRTSVHKLAARGSKILQPSQSRVFQIAHTMVTGSSGLVAMTSASHAEGRQFDLGLVYFLGIVRSQHTSPRANACLQGAWHIAHVGSFHPFKEGRPTC
jgi:hypothetical protein